MSYQAGLQTAKLYKSAIEEVINGVREAFLDEGIDEQVLQELKQIWESKVLATKAVDSLSDHPPPNTASSSSSASHSRSHQSSHSASGNASSASEMRAAEMRNASLANNVNTNNVHPTPAPSVVVAAPTITLEAAAAAAAAGGFSHLAGQHVFQPTVTNFAFPSGVLAGAGQSLIIPHHIAGGGSVNIPVRLYNAAQLPTVPAMQLNRRNVDGRNGNLPQVDGPAGISDDEDDFDDDDDGQEPLDEPAETGGVEEGEPLNSEDDVSNEDAEEMFEADNVVVCQYEKVTRTRNKWKFVLKDGVMSLDGKDYVFNRANGEAEF